MEIKILEKSANEMRFEVGGEDHTFCNALRKELWNDKDVTVAGYNIENALVSSPIVVISTKAGKKPEKAVLDATARLRKKYKSMASDFAKVK